MNGRSSRGTARACCAGIANQAVVTNVSAVLFVPFMRLYGFTYVQLGFLAAAGFAAQMAADILLLFLIDRAPSSALAALAAAMSCAGLVFYGCVPCLFAGAEFYGILAATVVFAFAGGMLEVVLSNAAGALPEGEASLPFLHTVYAWAQVALALFLLLWLSLFGAESWNFAVLALAALPAAVFALLPSARFPPPQKDAPARAAFTPLYLFAVFAVFFGYGAEAVMNQWVGTYAAQLFGEELGSAAGCALFALCLGIGGALYVRISGKKRAGLSLLIGCALPAAAAYLLAALLPGTSALAAAALCGLFVGVLSPGAMSAASAALPRTGGWMLASLAIAQDIGAAVLPALSGAAAEAVSVRAAFLFLAAAPVLSALAMVYMARAAKRAERIKKTLRMPQEKI